MTFWHISTNFYIWIQFYLFLILIIQSRIYRNTYTLILLIYLILISSIYIIYYNSYLVGDWTSSFSIEIIETRITMLWIVVFIDYFICLFTTTRSCKQNYSNVCKSFHIFYLLYYLHTIVVNKCDISLLIRI